MGCEEILKLKIGNAETFRAPESWEYTPDDRQQVFQLINGNVVQDYGHISSGDKISCSCSFTTKNYRIVYGYWESRQLVDVTDEAGNTYRNCRVVIKSYKYMPKFPDTIEATIEFWRL